MGTFLLLRNREKSFFATDTDVRRFRVRPIRNKSAFGGRGETGRIDRSARRNISSPRIEGIVGEKGGEKDGKNNTRLRSSTKWKIVLDLFLRAECLHGPAAKFAIEKDRIPRERMTRD